METGAVIGNIDLAQLVLYGFWIFFFGLIYYLRQEDRREGYPLHSEEGPGAQPNFFFIPTPKTFDLPHGGTATAPNFKPETREMKIEKREAWPGAPFVPTGDPMLDGVGPAAYAERADVPDLTMEGHPKIVPLRVATDFAPIEGATDPRGLDVVAGDGVTVGKVSDLWVDRSEQLIRYLEVELGEGGRRVLVPMVAAAVKSAMGGRHGRVVVNPIYGAHFPSIPTTANPDQITLLEEDKIQGYIAGGNLYADPERAEPFL